MPDQTLWQRVFGRRAPTGLFTDPLADSNAAPLAAGMFGAAQTNPPERTVANYLEAYSTMPWLHAVANKVATACASAQWTLAVAQRPDTRRAIRHCGLQQMRGAQRRKEFRRLEQTGELRRIDSHPMLDALSRGNALDIGLSVQRTTYLHLDLVGEAFWLKQRGVLDQPTAFWALPPHWVRDTPTPGSPAYTISTRGYNQDVPDSDVLWFKHADPLDPYRRGKGVTRALGDELETDEFAARMTRQFFYNSAQSQFLMMPDSDLGMEQGQVKDLERRWSRKAQGFLKAFRPMFVGQRVKVHEFKRDFRQLQLAELREHERNTIIQVWGVPPEILGVLENSNRATIDAAAYLFQRWVQAPRLEFVCAYLQERLAPEYDERLIVQYENPVEADREFQLKVVEAAHWAFDVDDLRELAEFEALGETDGGGLRWVPDGGRLVDQLEPTPEDTESDGDTDARASETIHVRAFADPDLTPGSALAGDHERAFADRTRQIFRDATDAVSETRLTERLTAGEDPERALRETMAVLDGFGQQQVTQLADVHVAGGHLEATTHGFALSKAISAAELERQAAAWAKRHGLNLTRRTVIGEQRAVLRDLRDVAVKRGWTERTLAIRMRAAVGLTTTQSRQVSRFYSAQLDAGVRETWARSRAQKLADSLRRTRAETIARTSMVEAVQAGKQSMWTSAQADGQIAATAETEWIAQFDATDETCVGLDGTRVAVGGTFAGGYKHPPVHPNCRCDLRLVVRTT